MKKRSLTITFSAFVLMLSATLAPAATFTLAQLDEGQEFTIGVLRFFNWDFDAVGSPVDPNNITITTIDDTAKPGFTLAGNGELTTGDELELNYAFDIETTNGQALIRRGEMNLQGFQQVDSVLAVALVEEVTGVDPSRLELFITQGVPGLQDTTFSTDTFAVPALFFPTVNAVGMRLFDVNGAAAVDSYSVQFVVGTASDDSVDLSGAVQDQGGTGLCAMVLASGQFTFSCNPNGPFSLTDLPRENDGTVKRQVYVDGFFPAVDVLQDSVDETVVMTRSGTCPNYNPPYNPGVFPESAGKRIDISGAVLQQNTQTPVCAMALANGQFTFSCDGSGSYALNIPLDANGQFKLQVYAEGFAPITQTFDEFQTINEVRLARATECQPPGTPPESNTVCNLALCAGDPTLAQQCETFVQTCLTAEGVLDEQCAAGGLFICLGEELPPDTDQSNVCTRDLCATDSALAQECQTFLEACLIAEPQNSDECVGGALLICSDLF